MRSPGVAEFAFGLLPAPDTARPRSCALRLRRFSRSAAARRRLRPADFSLLLSSFPVDVMAALSCPGLALQPEPLSCACGGPVAVSAAFAPFHFGRAHARCRSSVVEHPLGKGEVECSIHSGSTIPNFHSDTSRRHMNVVGRQTGLITRVHRFVGTLDMPGK